MEKNTQTPETKLHYYSSAIRRDMGNLLKWLILAAIVGYVAGAFSTLFSFVLKAVTSYRKANQWIFICCRSPAFALYFFMTMLGKDDGHQPGAFTVRSQDDVPRLSGPMIFVSTALAI